jgi:hypothetical protein
MAAAAAAAAGLAAALSARTALERLAAPAKRAGKQAWASDNKARARSRWDEYYSISKRRKISFEQFNRKLRRGTTHVDDMDDQWAQEVCGEMIAGGHDPDW